MRWIWTAALVVGCTDINQDELLLPRPDTGDEVDYSGPDRVLILNGKLSSKEAAYTLNRKGDDGRWIGPSLYVWDPGSPGTVTHLGWLDFGPDSPDHDWEIMAAREIAVAPDGTLWALMVDQGTNDEWIIARVDLSARQGVDQALPITAFVIHPDDTDLYGTDEYTGMGFTGDDLWLCSPADGAFPGQLFQLDRLPPTFEDDGFYYANPGLGALYADFDANLGCSGDIEDGVAVVRPGNDFASHALWSIDDAIGYGSLTTDPSEPITGLASANGHRWAVGIEGDLFHVDDDGVFVLVDQLQGLFPDDDLGQSTRRLRGAAGFTP